MDLKEIQQLVKLISSSNVDVLEIEEGDFHLKIKKNAVQQVAAQMVQPVMSTPQYATPPQASATNQAPVSKSEPTPTTTTPTEEEGEVIKSPMIGTFYRSSSPDKPSFVNVGDEVKAGQTLCIVEAMKLFNEIESEISGRIVKVLVDDASPVEYDQPLFLIEPI